MTIPQHLIDKAAHAMYMGDHPDAEFPDAPPWAQVRYEQRAQTALEAVAANIWGTGYNHGAADEITITLGIITDSERTPNPHIQETE